jgi:hypothetical protein
MKCKDTVYALNNIAMKYNLKISVNKLKMIAMKGKINARTILVINNHITEHINIFNYSGHTITLTYNRELAIKMNRFIQMCSIKRMNNKTRKDTYTHFHKDVVVPILIYGSEIQTKVKNRKQNLKL